MTDVDVDVDPFAVLDDYGGDVMAEGARLPSGTCVVEWRREYFESEQRSEDVIETRYQTLKDVKLASDGVVEFVDD